MTIDFESLRSQNLSQIEDQIRSRKLSSLELVEALMDRIHRTDKKVHAYATICEDEARKEAKMADGQMVRNHSLRPLHGLPISLKDIFDTKGIRTAYGHSPTSDYIPNQDCAVVAKFRALGAIILGKLHTHELAMGVKSPPTRNPWNLNCIPGGSSGGSGASIAVGSALFSMGSDTGGSIRIPASLCGVVGLKPTYASIENEGVLPQSWSLDHVGPMTRSVEDAEFIFSLIKSERKSKKLSTKRRKSNLRIGVPKNYFFDRCDTEVQKSVQSAIDLFEGLDIRVVEFEFPIIKEILAAYYAIVSCESTANHQSELFDSPENFGEDVRLFIERGLFIPATYYIQALRFRKIAAVKIAGLFNNFDAMITPTEPIPAPKIDEVTTSLSGSKEDIAHALVRNVCPFNYLGLPAMSIPCGFTKRGLPIGMQIIANFHSEEAIFEIGKAYESNTNWHLNVPTTA